MEYFKIISKTGDVISAEAIENPVYICCHESGNPVRCSKVKAQAILSLDGSEIYQLKGYEQMPEEYLVAESISQADYENIIAEMDVPEDDPDIPDIDPDESGHYEPIMTAKEMRERIIELEEERDALKDRAEMLEECVLEMSEVVYAGD